MRQTIDSLLSKTINELTNQYSDSETFYPRERIKELELRTKRRNNFKEELFTDMFPTEEELAYHKELLGLIRFAHRDGEVVFRMPQSTKELDLVSPLEKDKFEAFFVENLKHVLKSFLLRLLFDEVSKSASPKPTSLS
ncbi:hypothetical protein Tco_0196466 [Tanacetum coccineum]